MELKLFETICIQDGIPQHIHYHNQRLNRARKELFDINMPINILDYLIDIPQKGLYRAKLIYGKNIQKPTYYIYKAKKIKKLTLVRSDISYPYKFLDRTPIESIVTDSDIIIVKDNLLTDTSIANIALKQNGIWYTPTKPLLHGTTRARLIDENKLQCRDIYMNEIFKYNAIALMNAMIGFQELDTFILRDLQNILTISSTEVPNSTSCAG